ncbi:DUF6456 domain-containing protein [Acuticoccus sp. MNP-M23]|uniref:DUF6456 domain-containing protein n=1 Tax=Acuticoccus sp. MNP-M23 TaxID=3072793 RepID=UPI0028151D4F|nr:DUF6456 domain-containing protein [Acuticoccus sp. MNP-M23]WMS42040.1 DUF6456 domain-containing protein [Acuticoccus sp. MNP-M23]
MRREFARALKLIGERHAETTRGGALHLTSPREGEVVVAAADVATMVSEGLLARVRGQVQRTGAGRSYLRRALASAADEPFLAQHREIEIRHLPGDRPGDESVRVAANAAESPLAWLATRKGRNGAPLLTDTQRRAGERLARDYARGHHSDRVTQSWDASCVRGSARRDGMSASEGALQSRRRVEAALGAVGDGLADVLVAVCCEEIGLEAAEKRLGWPQRSGKVVLKLALDRLGAHYGLSEGAVGNGARTVHWGAADYRPKG